MAKLRARIRGGMFAVRVRNSFGETVNGIDLDRFAQINMRSFFNPRLVSKRVVDYCGPACISVRNRLQRPISDYEFFFIIEQIVDVTRELQRNNIPWDKVLWGIDAVYINNTTKELRFIYLPLNETRRNSNIMGFIWDLVYASKTADASSSTISRFACYLKLLPGYDYEKIEAYIAKEDKKIVELIRGRSGTGKNSGFITDKQREYEEHYQTKKEKNIIGETALLGTEAETGLMDEGTGLLGDNTIMGSVYTAANDEEAETGLLEEEQAGSNDINNQETGLLQENNTYETIYGEETIVLKETKTSCPTLYQVRTNNTIQINKPVFLIGKERNKVDYCVTNNNAVSREHAEIITRHNKYYIKDLGSTNKTFINDNMIPIRFETEIMNDDQIRLGNEEFVFHC